MRQWSLKKYALFCLFIFAITVIGRELGKPSSEVGAQSDTSMATLSPATKIDTIISRQDAEGVQSRDFDSATADRMTAYMRERMAVKVGEAGLAGVSFEPVVVEIDGTKLIVIRTRANGVASSITIAGVVGNELVRVGCFDRSGRTDVPLTTGDCAHAVNDAFGVRLPSAPSPAA